MHTAGVPTFNHVAAKQAIEAQGLTISEVARRIKKDRAVLSNILNGNRQGHVGLAIDIAGVTGHPAYAFVGPDDPETALLDLVIKSGISLERVIAFYEEAAA